MLRDPLLPRNATKNGLDAFVCGNRKRTGLLCGKCIDGYSVALNSPMFKCHHCTYKLHHWNFVPILVLPSSCECAVLHNNGSQHQNIYWTIGAFLFFSQIISIQYHYEFDSSLKVQPDVILITSNVILTIYSMSNLDFFHHNT